jgi:RNA polymerase sigma-70 factor, ECF subfamily
MAALTMTLAHQSPLSPRESGASRSPLRRSIWQARWRAPKQFVGPVVNVLVHEAAELCSSRRESNDAPTHELRSSNPSAAPTPCRTMTGDNLERTDPASRFERRQPVAGQADLLRSIHDEHGPALLRYVLRLTRGDREFAEDVVQESLLRLWQKPDILTTQPSESARAWLHTVAKNLVIDDRRSSRYKRELQTETVPEQRAVDTLAPAIDQWVLSEALRALSPEHRTVLVRAHYLGQTAQEIAQHEQIPPGTVKSRLHYAVRALRIALEERGVHQ